MRASKPFAIIIAALILAGCAKKAYEPIATTENYEKILESWVGSHVDSLVPSSVLI